MVATELENLKEFDEVLEFGEGAGEWVEAIGRCLAEDSKVEGPKRVTIARENSWTVRVEAVARELGGILKERS